MGNRRVTPALLTAVALLLTPISAPAQQESYECIMEPSVEIELSSPVSGILSAIRVDRGNFVKKGEELVRLDATAEEAAVELARAKLEFGQRKVERTQELFRENFTSASSTL